MVKYNFEIEKSKDNFNILKFYNENKKIYIGSKYNMQKYLDEFIENIKKDSKDKNIFIIFGLGSGEEIKKIRGFYPKNKIIIIEPNESLINYQKNNFNKFKFLQHNNVHIISSRDENLITTLKILLSECDVGKIIFKYLVNYDKIFKNEIIEFSNTLKELIIDKIIFRNTSILFAQTWFKTLMNNLKFISQSLPINLYENKFKNTPAIIVSAGPSLVKNIDQLQNINKNMLVLSGGRTLKPLIEKNIKPDLIGIVDPGDPSYELVEGYIDKCNVPLLFYEGTNEKVVKEHIGKKIFFTKTQTLKKIFNMDIKNLSVGGSIAHVLTSFAVLLGCNPIIFIGQDLAYTGEKFHADIAINQYNTIESNVVKDDQCIYVEDINGKMIRTSEVLNSFRRDLEFIIKNNFETTFINATEGGARIKGTIEMTLNEVINKYKLIKENSSVCINNKIDYKITHENLIQTLEESKITSDCIKKDCKKALNLLNDLKKIINLRKDSKINKILKSLDELDNTIKFKYKNLEILDMLLYPVAYTVISSYVAKEKGQIIKKNEFLYKSILEKTEYALETINSTLKDIKNMEI